MPIYAYRCESCGHEKDVLRKLSDAPPLTQCPACGKDTFSKQVTAAGFQLKGAGWYVTDFRGGNSGNNAGNGVSKDAKDAADAAPAKSDSGAASADNSSGSKPGDSAGSATVSSSDSSKPASGASAA